MSVTITQQPAAIAFSRNPMVWKLQALDGDMMPYRAYGARAYWRSDEYIYGFTPSDFTDGVTITHIATDPDGIDYSVVFTFRDTPTSENHLPALISEYANWYTYVQELVAIIGSHPRISPFFRTYLVIPSGSDIRIYIEALDTQPGWSMSWSCDLFSTSSLITETMVLSTDNEDPVATNLPADYRIRLDVFIEREYDSGIYTYAAQLEGVPNGNSECLFDISAILHREALLGLSDPPLPIFNSIVPQRAENLRRYYVRYTEITGEPDYDTDFSATKLVMLGGISQAYFADLDFFAGLDATNSLLTWSPDAKIVDSAQPEWLPFYNYSDASMQVVLELIRETNAAILTTLYLLDSEESPIIIPAHETWLLPVGVAQLEELSGQSFDDVLRYTVRVVDDTTDWAGGFAEYFSQGRTFYIDKKAYNDAPRYLQYLSGLWLPETLRCIGDFSKELEVDREESTRILAPDYSATTFETFQNSEAWNHIFRYHSGWMRKTDLDALQQLLISGNAWEVYEAGYMPLLLKEKRFRIFDSRENLYAVRIQCAPALKPRNYANTALLNTDTGGWLTVSGGFWKTLFGKPWSIV